MSKPETSEFDIVADKIDEDKGVYNTDKAIQEAMRFRFWCNGDDVMKETVEFFGPDIEKVLLQVKNYLIDKGWSDIKLSNIWFQYGDAETQMHRHSDGTIMNAEPNDCFTSMIFSAKEISTLYLLARSLRSASISFALRSQNSWPSFFS